MALDQTKLIVLRLVFGYVLLALLSPIALAEIKFTYQSHFTPEGFKNFENSAHVMDLDTRAALVGWQTGSPLPDKQIKGLVNFQWYSGNSPFPNMDTAQLQAILKIGIGQMPTDQDMRNFTLIGKSAEELGILPSQSELVKLGNRIQYEPSWNLPFFESESNELKPLVLVKVLRQNGAAIFKTTSGSYYFINYGIGILFINYRVGQIFYLGANNKLYLTRKNYSGNTLIQSTNIGYKLIKSN